MKTNLKKAISAVIALALSASLVPASFAAKLALSDVADTASYATAVNTLVALDVINGYEDGTFLPDNLITRAEATKVMVAALNQLNAAEGMKGSTQFTDVESRHEWATGYINAGVQNGYINGMGDGTFAPDANVTYAQMVKMLVSAMGYDDYATYMGGYPDGYLAIASTEGLTDGVSANKNQNVTRAQVAQLVYNALLAPIVQETGIEWTDNGQLRPKIQKMDGSTDDVTYKSLLTEKFDAYYVEGYVIDAVDKDEVNFGIAKSEKYDNDDVKYDGKALTTLADVVADGVKVQAYVGDTDAADYKGTYAAAIMSRNEYDEHTIISFQPSGKNKSVVFDASLIDTDTTDLSNNSIYIFANDAATKSTKYNLQTKDGKVDVNVYVNGFKVGNDAAAVSTYVLGADAGDVELVDTYRTDGYYDAIYVNKYATAWVDTVIASSKQITFKDCTEALGVLTLDEDANENLDYKIYYNGEEISMLELQENDVLSIAYDPTASTTGALKNSDYYEIYVSRNVKTGAVTGHNSDKTEWTIGGEVYGTVGDMTFDLRAEYVLYIDAFGRIYKTNQNTSAVKYAILDAYLVDTYQEYAGDRVRLYTAEGEVKTLVLDVDNAAAIEALAKEDLTKRVVKYSVSSRTGYVNSIEEVEVEDKTSDAEVYNASRNKVGSITLGDVTKVVDAIAYTKEGAGARYTDLALGSLASFVDDGKYTVYAYGEKSDGAYPFVIVTTGDSTYNADTHFAVVSGGIASGVEEDMEVTYIPVAAADAEKSLVGSDELEIYKEVTENETTTYEKVTTLNIGDVIVYTTDSAGYVDRIDVIFELPSTYKALVDGVVAGTDYVTLPLALETNGFSEDWKEGFNSADDAIQLVVGPVVEKDTSRNTFTIATIKDGKTDLTADEAAGGVYNIAMTSDTAVYTYDYANSSSTRVAKGVLGSVMNSIFTKEAYTDEVAKEVIDWADAAENDTDDNYVKMNVNLVFAKVVDDEATDVLVITGEYK